VEAKSFIKYIILSTFLSQINDSCLEAKFLFDHFIHLCVWLVIALLLGLSRPALLEVV
jgi:hypothetical protein